MRTTCVETLCGLPTIFFRRAYVGWTAGTDVKLDSGRLLIMFTGRLKKDGDLISGATVATPDETGQLAHTMPWNEPGGDYRSELIEAKVPRITRNVVRKQHEMLLARLDQIRAEARRHYEQSERAEDGFGRVTPCA